MGNIAQTPQSSGAADSAPPTQRRVAQTRKRSISHALQRLRSDPGLAALLLNAQMQLRWRAHTPLSVRLKGRIVARGGGEIRLGAGMTIFGTITPVELVAATPGRIEIGAGTFINYGVSISAHEAVTIGAGCHIGHYCFIYDNDEHDIERKWHLPQSRPVVIEDGVWLATRVIVLKGVRIGHDAVVAAGSVVTHDIPPCSVAAGVPARVIREIAPANCATN